MIPRGFAAGYDGPLWLPWWFERTIGMTAGEDTGMSRYCRDVDSLRQRDDFRQVLRSAAGGSL
jgi:hypothetical protein